MCKRCKLLKQTNEQLERKIARLEKRAVQASWDAEYARQTAERLDYMERMESGEWMGR